MSQQGISVRALLATKGCKGSYTLLLVTPLLVGSYWKPIQATSLTDLCRLLQTECNKHKRPDVQQSKPGTLTVMCHVPALIVFPGMQLAVQVQDDCPTTLDLSSLPVLNWTEETDACELVRDGARRS